MDVVVTGIGLASALGTAEESWTRLLAGESGLVHQQPFPELAARPLGMLGDRPSALPEFVDRVAAAALQDAGLELPLPDCGLVVGSSRGCQGLWEQRTRNGNGGSRAHWLELLPHCAAIAAARHLQTQAAVRAPAAACATGIWAIAQAAESIRCGEYDRAVAGALEAPVTPLTLTGFARMGALAQTGCYPFDTEREGLVLGEGGALFVLEAEPVARARGATAYGRVLGYGCTSDAHHLSAPAPDRRMAIAAVRRCLQQSQLAPNAVDYVHAHGTSTRLNDAAEAALLQSVFPRGVPVSSTKGATGHALGASGALGVAYCMKAIAQQVLPPNVGIRQVEFDLDVVTAARSQSVRHALCLSFGFGGQNAAIALGAF
ncbi:3-oxoacyl-(acyl-carrier-protein) synthase [Rubidibacter lacunae KORDI 51-2]|uniref:3-oxoacyl-(Acyl-carrier-protein) synthase n=1 Tax=Rubidibacter lacunae KORDI 51-2 TaxID=582515 RepID=U5DFF1_9CHRO|nr:beta-ketoacyl-ACP synthase [Rubidibacter lacunae]ERN40017.1 3-oxoacyl-(acyl-carrier-protein) synthase [Rubidibacter lacunae KORDI 51-2]